MFWSLYNIIIGVEVSWYPYTLIGEVLSNVLGSNIDKSLTAFRGIRTGKNCYIHPKSIIQPLCSNELSDYTACMCIMHFSNLFP